MAKGIDVNGQLRGKRGGMVYYRTGGEQLSRALNSNPHNPKTTAQAFQRMAFATVAAARAALAPIVNHSFEGVPYGTRSLSEFQRLNVKSAKAAAVANSATRNFLIKGASVLVPNPYQISRGQLTGLAYTPYAGVAGKVGVVIRNTGYGSLDLSVADEDTYKGILAALNCEAGDQLTLVAASISQQVAASYGSAKNYGSVVDYSRITFGEWDEATMAGQNFIVEGAINPVFIARAEGKPLEIGSVADAQSPLSPLPVFCISVDDQRSFGGAAIIRSKQDLNGKWLRSTAFMAWISPSSALASDVVASYTAAPADSFESSRILNNALNEGQQVNFNGPSAVQIGGLTINGHAVTVGGTRQILTTDALTGTVTVNNLEEGDNAFMAIGNFVQGADYTTGDTVGNVVAGIASISHAAFAVGDYQLWLILNGKCYRKACTIRVQEPPFESAITALTIDSVAAAQGSRKSVSADTATIAGTVSAYSAQHTLKVGTTLANSVAVSSTSFTGTISVAQSYEQIKLFIDGEAVQSWCEIRNDSEE